MDTVQANGTGKFDDFKARGFLVTKNQDITIDIDILCQLMRGDIMKCRDHKLTAQLIRARL